MAKEERAFNLLLVIDDKIRAKGPGYQQWATNYNLKQMAKTRIFLKEHNINSMDELREKASTTSADFDRIDKELKSAEQRLVEIAALKKHIINYAKTREAYVQYRKAGYSKAFFEAHREEITLHKAAKDAFQKMGVIQAAKGQGIVGGVCHCSGAEKEPVRAVQALQRRNAGVSEGTPQYGGVL